VQFNSLYYIPHLTIYNSQLYGGPDGELGAAMRYLSQRYSNTNRKVAGVLTDRSDFEIDVFPKVPK